MDLSGWCCEYHRTISFLTPNLDPTPANPATMGFTSPLGLGQGCQDRGLRGMKFSSITLEIAFDSIPGRRNPEPSNVSLGLRSSKGV